MKRYFYFAAAMILGMTFAACDGGNTPGKSEKNSLPAIVRSLKGLSNEDAGKKLADLKFARPENNDEQIWIYPGEMASVKSEENIRGKEYMYIYLTDNEEVRSFEGSQIILSSKDALDTYKVWDKYLAGEISKPTAWIAYVQLGEDEKSAMYFMDGSLVDTFRSTMFSMLDAALAVGTINQTTYDQYAEMYKATHADYTKYLASLKETDNFTIEETYVELEDSEKMIGTLTFSLFANYAENPEHILRHALQNGDVSEYLEDFSLEQNAPAAAPKFHFPARK